MDEGDNLPIQITDWDPLHTMQYNSRALVSKNLIDAIPPSDPEFCAFVVKRLTIKPNTNLCRPKG